MITKQGDQKFVECDSIPNKFVEDNIAMLIVK